MDLSLKHELSATNGKVAGGHQRTSCGTPILHARLRTGSIKNVSCGVRTHAQLPAVDLKSTPLTTRANLLYIEDRALLFKDLLSPVLPGCPKENFQY